MVFSWIGGLFNRGNNKSVTAPKKSSAGTSITNKPNSVVRPQGSIPFAPLANPVDRQVAQKTGNTTGRSPSPIVTGGKIPYSPLQATANRQPASSGLRTASPSIGGGGGGGSVGYALLGGGGGFSGGGGGVSATPETPPRLTDDEWLEKDTSYQALLASLANRASTFETENKAQRERSIQDYGQALARLGWNQEDKAWNTDDRTTGYGNAYQNLLNDFASRGMLQSTLYDQARTDLQSNYGRQRDEMGTAHTSALEELARALSGFQTETQQSRDQARMEALARRASLEMGR